MLGFAPAAAPRIYDGFFDWDTGLLAADGGRLTFLGERTAFELRRDAVTSVTLGPGVPAWWSPPRVYVAWQAGGFAGVFQLSVAPTWWGRRRAAAALRDRLEQWRTRPGASEDLPDVLPPTEGSAPGRSPQGVLTPPVMVSLLLPRLLLTALACGLLGLSFNPNRGGPAWAAVSATAAETLLQMIPYWRYREPNAAPR